jgi:histidinol-phosphate aminotransferase
MAPSTTPNLRRWGSRQKQVTDFSSNLNPFGPPSSVRAALSALDPAPYPDRSCLRLRMRLAHLHGCEPDRILVGNGANELIHLIAHTPRQTARNGAGHCACLW